MKREHIHASGCVYLVLNKVKKWLFLILLEGGSLIKDSREENSINPSPLLSSIFKFTFTYVNIVYFNMSQIVYVMLSKPKRK